MEQGADWAAVSVLGPALVAVRGRAVALRPMERAVAAALALRHPRPVAVEDLVHILWPTPRPEAARKALHNHVRRLRQTAGSDLVRTNRDGYALADGVVVDRVEFECGVEQAARAEAGGDLARARAHLETALSRWRGEPYVDLGHNDREVAAARRRLTEVRLGAEERLAEAMLRLRDESAASAYLEQLVEEMPLRERRWWLLMLAQYRTGRHGDALASIVRARRTLVERAGIEPGDELRDLERRVLDEDPTLLTAAAFDMEPDPRPEVTAEMPSAFVGRAVQRHELAVLAEQAVAGHPAVAVVRSEAGRGKTTLARRVARDAAELGMRVLWSACDEAATVPLQPFVAALRALADDAPHDFAGWVADPLALSAIAPELVTPAARSSGGEPAARDRVSGAVVATLAAASRGQPLLLVVDDLHLASPFTQRLVRRCAEGGSALLVLGTARVEALVPELDAPGPLVTHVDLPAFTVDEVSQFLATVLGDGRPTPDAARVVADQTAGNPFYVRELTRALLAQGALRPGPEGWVVERLDEVPATLAGTLLQRLVDLDTSARRVVAAAAVLGPRFRRVDLGHMVGSAAAAIEGARRAGIVVAGEQPGELEFTHELMRRVLYESIPPGTRLELHELAAQAVEVGPHRVALESDIARHALAASSLDPERAVDAARRAGDAAIARFAYEEGADLYEAARRVLDEDGADATREGCLLAIRRGEALRRAGDVRSLDVLLAAAGAADRLRDGDLLAEAALSLCFLGPTTEAWRGNQQVAAVAARALRQAQDARLRAEVAGAASLLHSLTGDPTTCRTLFDLAVTEARALDDPIVLAHVLPYAYLALADPDDLHRREAIADELVALGRDLGQLTTEWEGLQLRFSVQLQCADPDLDQALARMTEIAEIVHEPARDWEMRYLTAAVAHLHGDLDRAEDEITRSLDYIGVVAESRVMAAYSGQLVGLRHDQGRLPELAPAIEAFVNDQPDLAAWRAAMCFAAAAAGDRERATQEFDIVAADDFAALPRDFIWTGAMTMLGIALACIDDAGRAAALHARLRPYAGRMSWIGTCTFGPIDAALATAAHVAGLDCAAPHLETAARLVDRIGAPVMATRIARLQP